MKITSHLNLWKTMKVIQQKRGGIICRKGSLVAPSMLYFCVQIGVKGLLARSHAHKTLWMSRTQAQCWIRSQLFSRPDIAVTVFEHRPWWHKNLKPSRVPFDFTLYKAGKMNIEFSKHLPFLLSSDLFTIWQNCQILYIFLCLPP